MELLQEFVYATGCAAVDAKLASFAGYFESTWVSGAFSPQLWTHFDHLGPRTTNVAEGFHNSLNTRFGMPHPTLRTFLDWLQKCQYETQSHAMQLESGRPPKPKSSVYVQLDANVQSAKLQYGMNIGNVFACIFPSTDSWEMFRLHTSDYLRRISYLVGA